MDAQSVPTTASTPAVHSDSADFSPRHRQNDALHADPPPASKLRLMCSYGGHIVPRPHDKALRYIGGDTRIIVMDRQICLSDLHAQLSRNLLHNQTFFLKYQLPGEDLDALISVNTDEDLENMMEEYDRVNNDGGRQKQGRLRLFLFAKSPSGIEHVLESSSAKSADWFFDTLNGKASSFAAASDRGFSESSSVNCLLGLDDDLMAKAAVEEKDFEAPIDGGKIGGNGTENVNGGGNCAIYHDVHSIPDSPMVGTTSPFGSASSSPSAPSLPPTAPNVEEHPKAGIVGIEEQFQHMRVDVGGNVNLSPLHKQEEVGSLTAAGATAATVTSESPILVGGEGANRVMFDDERADHGGCRKAQQSQQQQVQAHWQPQHIPQTLQKPTAALDASSPGSLSSEGNERNPLSTQAIYQKQLKQIQPGNSKISSNQADPKPGDQNNSDIEMQSLAQEPGYLSPGQYDQNHPQLHQAPHFVPAPNHFIPAGPMPVMSYYPIYPSQQQHNPHPPYPVYMLPGNQNHSYNLPVQQPNYSELAQTTPCSCPQTPPSAVDSHTTFSQAMNVPSSKPEIVGGMYQPVAPQLVQVSTGQHQVQYVALYPPQSVAPSSAANPAYDFADQAHLKMYYRLFPPHLAAQCHTIPSTPAVATPDTSAQHNPENINQQVKTSQP